ncbi:hypothetical protein CR513_45213, partial [Mucuna pruriens]
MRINLGLYLNQPVEVVLEILHSINFPFSVAILTVVVNSQVKVLIIEESLSGVLGDKRSHVLVKYSCQVYVMICYLFPWLIPIRLVLDLPQVPSSARTTPKLAPPPPLMAQKRSSPIDFLSSNLP